MRAVHLPALRGGHLDKHLGGSDAVGVLSFAGVSKAELGGGIFNIAVVREDVQTATGAVALVDGANERKHVGNRWAVARFVDSHKRTDCSTGAA